MINAVAWIETQSLYFLSFSFSGRLVYWLFLFCVSVAFVAILIAQFETSYKNLANKAHLNVILKKTEIMQKMDRFFTIFVWLLKRAPYVSDFFNPFQC